MDTITSAKVKNTFRVLYYHIGLRMPCLIKGFLLRNSVRAYWYRDILNFGDLITPLLLKEYGFTPIHSLPNNAVLVSTGSILEHLPENYAGNILGSGFIYEKSQMPFPNARIFSVRGALSLERLGRCHSKVTLGDPGLLASRVMTKREVKKYILGIVPHHVDFASPTIRKIATNNSPDVSVIDVQQQPMKVFHLIDKCEYVLSSSLHGLVVADSLGIPNGWLFAEGIVGGRFKFDDYYSSLNFSVAQPFKLTGDETLSELCGMASIKPTDRIIELQDSLTKQWLLLKQTI